MVKPPKIRHSKSQREPVTIDHEPTDAKKETASRPSEDSQKTGPTAATSEKATGAAPKPQENSANAQTGEAAAKATTETAASKAAGKAETSDKPETKAAQKPAQPEASSSGFGRGATGSAAGKDGGANTSARGETAARPAQPKRGGISLVAAGLIGGVIALLGGGAAQYAGLLPAPAGPSDEAELVAIRAEIAALEERIAAGGENGGGAEAIAAANGRIDTLSSDIETLRTQVADIQSSIAGGGAGEDAALQALDVRLKSLEERIAALGEGGGDTSNEALAALTERLAGMETTLGTARDAATAAQSATSANAEKLAALETEFQALSERVDAQASNPKIALAIAAAGLKAAIDRGVPFMAELETYAAIAPEAPEIAQLREMAAAGVPTRTQIEQEVADAANLMVAAANPVDENAGLFERLLASLESLVKVRPIGEVEGEGVGATVARLETAVRSGNYDKAIAEFETLPEPVRAAGEPFMAKVRARSTADALVEKALTGALRA